MILDELTVHNVGTFAGRHVLRLTPPARSRPIALVGGLNGAGKTTLLQAIHLALYGPLAQPTGRRPGSYEAYLRGLINHSVPTRDGAAVELAFHAHQEGVPRHYRIVRSWRDTGAAVRERLEVEIDGRADETLTATWAEHIETFLPRGIAGLFFFDGEQIEALADLDRSRQVLETALTALLGLDMVDRLAIDLTVLRRRHPARRFPPELREMVDACRDTATTARQAEAAAAAAAAAARVEVERASKRLLAATERYRSAGGELFDQRESAETKLRRLRDDLAHVEDELRELAAGVAPLAQAAELLEAVVAQARSEGHALRERVVLEVVDARDQVVLDRLRGSRIRATVVAAIEQFLADDREERRKAAAIALVTGLPDAASVEFLISTALPDAARHTDGLLDRRRDVRTAVEAAERLVAAIPDLDALSPARDERDAAHAELLRTQAALAHAEDRLAALRQERARAVAAYEAAMDKTADATIIDADDRRIVDHANRVSATLESLKTAITERHLHRISDLVLDALGRLLRKQTLITGIRIDPGTYTVNLTGPFDRPLSATELSAGERQLLAVALLWGLARAAGQPLPVIIDTPLGRLDRSHREHLLDRYFPQASHQVILLSTDTEIGEEEYRRLHRHIGHAYTLEFDQDRTATSVTSGYFAEQ